MAVGAGVRPTQDRLGPGDQFVEAERLLDVVVATERQPAHLVVGRIARRQEQHRRAIAVGAQPPAHLESVEVGHHHVEQHQVGLLLRDQLERLATVLGRGHGEPVVLERSGEHRSEVVLVVDDEQVLAGHGCQHDIAS